MTDPQPDVTAQELDEIEARARADRDACSRRYEGMPECVWPFCQCLHPFDFKIDVLRLAAALRTSNAAIAEAGRLGRLEGLREGAEIAGALPYASAQDAADAINAAASRLEGK